jgi:hypothetical protein
VSIPVAPFPAEPDVLLLDIAVPALGAPDDKPPILSAQVRLGRFGVRS